MVLADAFYYTTEKGAKEWVNPTEVELEKDEKGRVIKATSKDGKALEYAGMSKMSKSKNNGVDPQEAIDVYGADTVRLYTMFAAPPEQTLEWSDAGVQGAQKFLQRVWRLTYDLVQGGDIPELNVDALDKGQKDARRKIHETIQKVSDDVGRRYSFNTAIAAMMELSNYLQKMDKDAEQSRAVIAEGIKALVLMLAPTTPHICDELWKALGNDSDMLDAAWPTVDEKALEKDSIQMVVQVNGKVRTKLELPANISKDDAEAAALADENVQRFIDGNTVRKVIVVPGKLVNIVAN